MEAVPLEYDATVGFILKNPTDYFQKAFICIAKYKGRESSIHLDLETIRETESIPQVYINDANAKYVLVGQTFYLECVVQAEISTMVTVTWSYPVKNANRVHEKSLEVVKSNAYQNITKELIISNSKKSDEGVYQCNATDHSKKENYAQVYVKIFETPQKPKVYFDSGLEEIIKNLNETVELVATFEVFPPTSDIRPLWSKDKKPIPPGLDKYFTKRKDSAFVLEILSVNRKDSGEYTVTVNSPGGRSEKSFFLRVRDKPEVMIRNSSCCYNPGEKYVLICEVTGLPAPSVSWNWKPYCLNVTESNSLNECVNWKTLDKYYSVNNSTVAMSYEAEKIILSLSVIAEETGYYKCKGENVFGIEEKEIHFVVTDIKSGFEVNYNNNFPEVGSYFSATCSASLILYTQVLWKWIAVGGNESAVLETGILVNTTDSMSIQLERKRMLKNESGTYICEATLRNEEKVEERSLFVEVRDHVWEVQHRSTASDLPQIIFPLCVGIALIILVSIYVGRCLCIKKRGQVFFDFEHHLLSEGQMAMFDPNAPLDEQIDLLPYDEIWEFPKEKLKLGRTVGQGAFGRVVKAEAFEINDYEPSTIVAVKMLKERADVIQQKALMDELKILIHLGHHVNIVNLMGAVTKNIRMGELLVIVEYCRYGNLRNYLHRHRDTFVNEIDFESGRVVSLFDNFATDESEAGPPPFSVISALDNPTYREKCVVCSNPRGSSTGQTIVYSTSGSSGSGSVFRNYYRADSEDHILTTSDLICYAFQCARGMDYLASRKLIHRDLAARNVLLADNKIVKICDFGLAKDCYKYSNVVKKEEGPLPIKWMAIESIWDHIFTTKSDIWSFGVLMWEFFTLGGNPYPGIDIDEEFYRKVKAGYRMEKPELCPDIVYQLMRDCWKAKPDERPDFNQVAETLGDSLGDGMKQHYIDLNEPYMEMNRKMKVPDYLNVPKLEDQAQRIYMNSDDIQAYDIPKSIPKEALEIFPMIQLDSVSETTDYENTSGQ